MKIIDSDDERIITALGIHSKSTHLNLCNKCPLKDSEEEDDDGNYEGECTFLLANGALKIIDKLQKTIEEQEERIAIMMEGKDEWTSIKKEKPKESGTYLVVLKQTVNGCVEETIVTQRDWMKAFGMFAGLADEEITHWMPLPKPPKEDADNG